MNINSRRNFIKSMSGLAGAGMLGIPFLKPGGNLTMISHATSNLITRKLGDTGIVLPVVSMGVMNSNNPNLVKEAWKSGIRHFDTAWVYQNGNNEKMVGNALKEIKANRQNVIVATKTMLRNRMNGFAKGKEAREVILRQLNDSLSRLQMDYIDILYIHDVSSTDLINDPYIQDTFTELKTRKKIRFCGFTSHVHWPEIVNDAARKKFYDVILLSFNISLGDDPTSINALKNASKAGIGLIAMKTQCQQDWYKHQLPSETQKFYEGKIMNTALLKWVLKHEYITTAVPGFTTFQQMEEDLVVMNNLEYSAEEKQFLSDRNIKLAMLGICRHCGKCMDSCPYRADIPSLMRVHMYSRVYGNATQARQTMDQIHAHRGLDVCTACNPCTAECSRSVPVSNRIAELKELYC